MIRKSIALLTVSLLLFSLGACTQPTETGTTIDDVNLKIVTTFGPNDGGHQIFQTLCDEFAADTKAVLENVSADATEQWKQEVLESFDSGSAPDVLFFFSGENAEALVSSNKVVPFSEIYEEYPDYAGNINLAVLESMKASDGENYAVPIKGYWERIFVNTDIFAELNLELPASYEDLFDTAPALLAAGYIPIAASLNEVPHYLFESFVFDQSGPSRHQEIPDDANNLPESWVWGLNQFKLAYDAGLFPPDGMADTHADALELFQQKKAAMIVDGDWSMAQIRDAEHTAVINFPASSSGARKNTDLISGFSMGFYISRNAWNDAGKRAAAVAFVEYVTSNASIERLNVSGASMPVAMLGSDGEEDGEDGKTNLRRSADRLNEQTTAFVSAVQDKMKPDARTWLFTQILPIAQGIVTAEDVLVEFIARNR